ncbi:serine protease inhibitor 3/4-like [Xylocopa sonorina]|uniref:serine protease inhibitor 3/4-like n=1 Tax=Xylocopa sonorina TaxID=1818115 RepID=UPI00403A8311
MIPVLKTLLMAMVALKTVSAEGSASGTVQKLNLFSSSLFHAVAKGNPGQTNLITSPFTTGVTLAMAACGAQGQTLSQFKTMFNILPRDKIDMPGYQVIIDDLNNIRQNKLALTNKMFTAKHFIVNGDYKDLTDNYFRSVAQAVDFTQPEIAGNTINTWVRRNTNNLINNIIPGL